jgi:hypothetical protein
MWGESPRRILAADLKLKMDIAWIVLAICVVVGAAFCALARHWHRLLAHHSWAIRRLNERLQALEAVEDPDFRRKLGDSTPSPLERVYTFSFRLSDRFWQETLQASPEQRDYVRTYGKFLGSVKIERWRSHAVITLYEILPQSHSAGWQTRCLDVYPSGDGYFEASPGQSDGSNLWELPLAAPGTEASPEAVTSLELRLEGDALALCARRGPPSVGLDAAATLSVGESILFLVPLDTAKLAPFRKGNGSDSLGGIHGAAMHRGSTFQTNSWMMLYEYEDERQGFDWQLCIRDLVKRANWEQWKVWRTTETRNSS